jgi:hypothetical protein
MDDLISFLDRKIDGLESRIISRIEGVEKSLECLRDRPVLCRKMFVTRREFFLMVGWCTGLTSLVLLALGVT